MKYLSTIALHEGTGTAQVKRALQDINPKVTIRMVTTIEQAGEVKFDGLMLLGGSDIHPFFYGQRVRHARPGEADRDRVEWMLARRALADGKPIFGICRGHQMLAIAAGGSLHQDIHHAGLCDYHPSTHKLRDVKVRLRKHLPAYTVNSYHHQSVASVPRGFEVMAMSDDGVIESIYAEGVLGVQWHPELMIGHDKKWLSLFRWFMSGLK